MKIVDCTDKFREQNRFLISATAILVFSQNLIIIQKNAHHYYIEFISNNNSPILEVSKCTIKNWRNYAGVGEEFEEAKKYFHLVPGRRKHGLFPVVIVVAGNSLYFDYFQL